MKIALVGSAPSSVAHAPFDDPSWGIWGCSPGAWPHLKRLDAFFEIHRWSLNERGFTPQYIAWMASLTCPVYVIEKREDIPASIAYPTDQILAKYPGLARSFFTSSLAWMLALAIENIEERRANPPYLFTPAGRDEKGRFTPESRELIEEEHEIGLWGVDMAAADEYGHQKPGCHFFILEAEKRGIKVTVPPQSDLLRPIPMYGIGEAHPMRIKLEIRRQELEQRAGEIGARMAGADKAYQDARGELLFVQGALDDLQYHLQTWVG